MPKYTINKGKILDSSGTAVTPKNVAWDAQHAADLAKGNAQTARSFPPAAKAAKAANRILLQDARDAQNILDQYHGGKKK